MYYRTARPRFRTLLGFGLALASAAAAPGCIDRPIAAIQPRTQVVGGLGLTNEGVTQVDLLLEVDNSISMRENQRNIAAQLGPLIQTLTNPPDADHDGQPDYPAVADLHVGVISSDLGAPESGYSSCASALGDDGVLNPLARGAALRAHPPSASDRFVPGCQSFESYPSFLTFDSASTDREAFATAFACSADLGTTGCGFESQLESVYRALVTHRADDGAGNNDPNAGFLRENALLAIVVLTDEEDGSVRDDARDVYRRDSTAWRTDRDHMNSRFYLYDPGSPQDPTWSLDRYVDPRNPRAGLFGLKPDHPERIVFAAIAGVPLDVPTRPVATGAAIDWDALLGTPDPTDRNNFAGRSPAGALNDPTHTGGSISMRPNNPDPDCPDSDTHPVVPACRRGAHASCTNTDTEYFALPSRRVVEIARRFDEEPLCDGRACHNGLVASVCATDYTAAMQLIVDKIREHLPSTCLVRALQAQTDINGLRVANCTVQEVLPVGESCDAARGRVPLLDERGAQRFQVDASGTRRAMCEVRQVPTGTDGAPRTDVEPAGWFYDTRSDPRDGNCPQRVSFTTGASVPPGASDSFQCVQAVSDPPSQ